MLLNSVVCVVIGQPELVRKSRMLDVVETTARRSDKGDAAKLSERTSATPLMFPDARVWERVQGGGV